MTYARSDVWMVEGHIVQGERHIIRQQELIERLRSRGLPTDRAEQLLDEFQSTLRQHWQHRTAMLESLRLTGEDY